MATTSKGVTPGPTGAALEQLEKVRDQAVTGIAVRLGRAGDLYADEIQHAEEQRSYWARVSRMAGIGDVPEFRTEVKVVRL